MSCIRVEVVLAFSDGAKVIGVELPAGATVGEALNASGVSAADAVGVYGRVVSLETKLKDGDRVEIYRPLTADPKEQRRQRAAKKRR